MANSAATRKPWILPEQKSSVTLLAFGIGLECPKHAPFLRVWSEKLH